jgi:hypothetical protein
MNVMVLFLLQSGYMVFTLFLRIALIGSSSQGSNLVFQELS